MKPKSCVKCPKFERVAENAGFCHKYGWQIGIEVAKRDVVCRDMEEENKK